MKKNTCWLELGFKNRPLYISNNAFPLIGHMTSARPLEQFSNIELSVLNF